MAGKPDKGPGSAPSGRVSPSKSAASKPAPLESPASRRAATKEAKAAREGKAAPSGAEIRKAARSGNPKKVASAVGGSARYTPPVPRADRPSPIWVPILMFGLLGLGMLLIFLNYISWPFGDPSNVRLIIGLAMILAGILVATQLR
ncbi:MAG: cell division protein CrgA [Actinobacteria bacterium]|nr:cell division protein CrgA [Actinomycetota bacterium]